MHKQIVMRGKRRPEALKINGVSGVNPSYGVAGKIKRTVTARITGQ